MIRTITDQVVWTDFFNKVGSISFHQSYEWGEFQKSLHYDILRLGLYDNEKLIAIALVIKIRSKRGRFLFVPHGPIFDISAENLAQELADKETDTILKHLNTFTNYLKELARREGFWFIRVAPSFSEKPIHKNLFAHAGYRTAPIYMHAETMWALDITHPEEEILAGMRKNTRYDIRRGIKENIVVEKNNDLSSIDTFWKLYEKTFSREHFTPFPKSFITEEFKSFNKSQNASFFFGEAPKKSTDRGASEVLAGSLVLFTKSCAFYHQGASIHSTYPVPHQVQWQTILEAKRRGCQFYNLYGIYKPGRTPISWEGLTLFKRGFGGFQVDYLPTQDFVISPKYYFSFVVDKYLAYRRGIK
ncbi:hypothetical protein BH09PAT2_BH09PAT2_03490 [soil metagenome]